jgi:hypothetical protein
VPVTIRYADSLDETALATLAALDSAEALTLPALVAEVEGELRASLSLIDSIVIADPFHPTVELVALLQTRAQQLALEPRAGLLARLRAPLRLARAVRLELRDFELRERWIGQVPADQCRDLIGALAGNSVGPTGDHM